jgi:cytochrome c oxidase assembly protein subunit 15
MLFGAYVAGLEAGYAFNTWPLMGDELYPAARPGWSRSRATSSTIRSWFSSSTAGWPSWRRRDRPAGVAGLSSRPTGEAAMLFAAVTIQIVLGIATILSGVQLWLGVAHQGMAALLLAALVVAAHRLGERAA